MSYPTSEHANIEEETTFEKAQDAIRAWLVGMGVTDAEVLANTPRRWLTFIKDTSIALREPYTDFKCFESEYNQMIVVDVGFVSICEHHLLPYYGRVFLGYMPTTKVIGVSKIIKMVTHLSKKPSIQEKLTEEICKTFSKNVPNAGTAVTIEAFHTCVSARYKEGRMLTSSLHGVMRHNPYAKLEYLDYIKSKLGDTK